MYEFRVGVKLFLFWGYDGFFVLLGLILFRVYLGLEFVVQFEQFVKVLQARRDAFLQLTELLKRASTDEQKKSIQTQLDQATELLDKGNKEMAESVGYSLTHNYEIEVLEAKFVFLLNQEEVNQVQNLFANSQQQQAAAATLDAPKVEKRLTEKKN